MPFPAPRYGATGPADPPDPRHPCPSCEAERSPTDGGHVCPACDPALCPDCGAPTHWRPMTFRPDILTPAACDPCPEPR